MIDLRRSFTLFCIAGLLGTETCIASAGPLYCAVPVHNFGTVIEGDSVSHRFIVKNRSQKPVKVERMITTCGCIAPLRKGFVLRPGESIDVPIKFGSRGYGGQTIKKEMLLLGGENHKTLLIRLAISGKIKGIPPEERIDVIPKQISILNVVTVKHEILIHGPVGKVVHVEAQGPKWMNILIKRLNSNNGTRRTRWILEFSLTKPLSAITEGNIIIKSNLPRFETIRIPIAVRIKPLLCVSPPILFVRSSRGTNCKKEFEITILESFFAKNSSSSGKYEETVYKAESAPKSCVSTSTSSNMREPIISIQPSNDSIQLQQLPDGLHNRRKYVVTIKGNIPSPQNLKVMIDNVLVSKIPIIISLPSTERRLSEK